MSGLDRVGDVGKRIVAVERCRGLTKRDMVLNDALPKVQIDPETYEVLADGVKLTATPTSTVPLGRLYTLF